MQAMHGKNKFYKTHADIPAWSKLYYDIILYEKHNFEKVSLPIYLKESTFILFTRDFQII